MKKGFSIIMAFVTVMTMLFSGATFADDYEWKYRK